MPNIAHGMLIVSWKQRNKEESFLLVPAEKSQTGQDFGSQISLPDGNFDKKRCGTTPMRGGS